MELSAGDHIAFYLNDLTVSFGSKNNERYSFDFGTGRDDKHIVGVKDYPGAEATTRLIANVLNLSYKLTWEDTYLIVFQFF